MTLFVNYFYGIGPFVLSDHFWICSQWLIRLCNGLDIYICHRWVTPGNNFCQIVLSSLTVCQLHQPILTNTSTVTYSAIITHNSDHQNLLRVNCCCELYYSFNNKILLDSVKLPCCITVQSIGCIPGHVCVPSGTVTCTLLRCPLSTRLNCTLYRRPYLVSV